ncbi:hypothetical protein GCM10020367_63140 [Streptomyces sannanensis]|uniref:Uncharacterized protein n=1 Tax=Streptomyces sannanensis TaxID=285536 RepID=A0ABP6SLB8_9ACTN
MEEFLVGAPIPPGIGDYVSVENVVTGGGIVRPSVTGKFALAVPFSETRQFCLR